jgi:hypothetical protein
MGLEIMGKIALLNLCLVLILYGLLSGCSSSVSTSTPKTFWYQSREEIQTNDLIRLSELVPFKIVTPAYIPQELKVSMPRLVKNNTGWSNESIEIRIEYDNQYSEISDDPKFVHITEDNSSQTQESNQLVESIAYIEEKTKITQQKGKVEFISRDGKFIKEKYNFFWKKDGINYSVDISGYDLEASRKVIKSMLY